jgi:hypothetical protein
MRRDVNVVMLVSTFFNPYIDPCTMMIHKIQLKECFGQEFIAKQFFCTIGLIAVPLSYGSDKEEEEKNRWKESIPGRRATYVR